MSAYLCNACHLTALALYAVREGLCRGVFRHDLDRAEREVFDLLARANWEGVRAAHPRQPDPGVVQGPLCKHGAAQRPRGLEIVKACHCFEHQASDAPGWEDSEACKLIREIERHAVQEVDGYEAEEWGFRCLHAEEPRPAPAVQPRPRRAAGLEKWLAVEVYRPQYDCTNRGVSSLGWTLYVPHESGPVRDPQLAAQLVPGERGGALYFVPRTLEGGPRWFMFGGNFVHSSDARFSERYGRAPVAVHDRVEG